MGDHAGRGEDDTSCATRGRPDDLTALHRTRGQLRGVGFTI
jgi:hypothetical protein